MNQQTDDELRAALMAATDDPMEFVTLVHAYYADQARADGTSRALMHLHLGIACGMILRLTRPDLRTWIGFDRAVDRDHGVEVRTATDDEQIEALEAALGCRCRTCGHRDVEHGAGGICAVCGLACWT